MPANKYIDIDISPEGEITIEVEGYTDGSCRTATEALEKALGSVRQRDLKQGGACSVEKKVKVT